MSMDNDFDFTFAPSGTIYGSRAVKLDPATADACYLGSVNSVCVGVTPQQSEYAPGMIGNTTFPMVLAQPGDNSIVPVYGPGRNVLWDVDPGFGGQLKPGDLMICGNSGYATKASPFGPWNQWVLAISRSFANSGQSCNCKIVGPWPWMPTGS